MCVCVCVCVCVVSRFLNTAASSQTGEGGCSRKLWIENRKSHLEHEKKRCVVYGLPGSKNTLIGLTASTAPACCRLGPAGRTYTFGNTQWWKINQTQPMWLYILLARLEQKHINWINCSCCCGQLSWASIDSSTNGQPKLLRSKCWRSRLYLYCDEFLEIYSSFSW